MSNTSLSLGNLRAFAIVLVVSFHSAIAYVAFRLGVPFILGVGLLMPVAHYPVYAVAAANPSWHEFWEQWLSVPFWHSGPLWFLWVLLAFDLVAAAVFRFLPAVGERLPAIAVWAADAPGRFFIGFAGAAALAY